MKKTLKISGIIGISAIVLASFLKIVHLPGAGPSLVLGFASLLLAYLPTLYLTIKKEKILKRNTQLAYVGIITAFVFLISVLFTLQHWPFGDYTTFLSWIFLFVFLIMLFRNIMKTEENRVINLSLILFFSILLIIDVTLYFVRLKNPRLNKFTIENNFDSSINLYKHKTEKAYLLQTAIKDNSYASDIAELRTKTNEIIGKTEKIRNELFATKEQKDNYNKQILKKTVISNNFEDEIYKLESEVEAYQKFMLNKTSNAPELNSFIKESIVFGWLERNNDEQVIYNNMQKLIRDIKIAESEVLEGIQQAQLITIKK